MFLPFGVRRNWRGPLPGRREKEEGVAKPRRPSFCDRSSISSGDAAGDCKARPAQTETGTGVATGPRPGVPPEAFRPRPVPNRAFVGASSGGGPIRVPVKASLDAFPCGFLPGGPGGYPFAIPSPEGSGFAGLREIRVRHRLAPSPRSSSPAALPSLSRLSSRRISAASAVAALGSFRPLPGGRS